MICLRPWVPFRRKHFFPKKCSQSTLIESTRAVRFNQFAISVLKLLFGASKVWKCLKCEPQSLKGFQWMPSKKLADDQQTTCYYMLLGTKKLSKDLSIGRCRSLWQLRRWPEEKPERESRYLYQTALLAGVRRVCNLHFLLLTLNRVRQQEICFTNYQFFNTIFVLQFGITVLY